MKPIIYRALTHLQDSLDREARRLKQRKAGILEEMAALERDRHFITSFGMKVIMKRLDDLEYKLGTVDNKLITLGDAQKAIHEEMGIPEREIV